MSTPTPILPQAPSPLIAFLLSVWQGLWSILKLPLQVLALGAAILLLFWMTTRLHPPPGLNQLWTAFSGQELAPTLVALLVFAVGLTFAIFLWWVVGRFFTLLSNGMLPKDSLESLRDLPLGLPEGTVRSILALIVAVVGLPILLFSGVLGISPEVAGYINGIVTGVFGFYFGTRAGGVNTRALNQIAVAQNQAQQARDERDSAQTAAHEATSAVAAAEARTQDAAQQAAAVKRAADFDTVVDELSRQAGVASTVLSVIAPALPAGMLPQSLAQAVSTAQSALNAVRGVGKEAVTNDQLQALETAVGTLTGEVGSGSSIGRLISQAAPMLASAGLSGLTPASAIAILIAVGYRLGSTPYQRWRARVLAAPLVSGLIASGTITPDDIQGALADAPIFASAFAEAKDDPGFAATLAGLVLGDDALDLLWNRYGGGTPGQPPLFQDRGELQQGLLQFQQVLLGLRAAADIADDTLPNAISASLAKAANPAFRAGPLDRETVNRIIGAASQVSASGTATSEARAAFDALVTLVGHSRQNGIDLVKAITEVAP